MKDYTYFLIHQKATFLKEILEEKNRKYETKRLEVKPMTDAEVLRKAIEKANGKGYKLPFGWGLCHRVGCINLIFDGGRGELGSHIEETEFWRIIFSHSFAKAFWGLARPGIDDIPDWQYHLRQMVLEENPIDYLRKFIDQKEEKEKGDENRTP